MPAGTTGAAEAACVAAAAGLALEWVKGWESFMRIGVPDSGDRYWLMLGKTTSKRE